MMSGLPSGLRVSDWKIAPTHPEGAAQHQGHQRSGQPPLQHDQVVPRAALTEQGGHDVTDRDREVAGGQRDDHDPQCDGGQDQADQDQATLDPQ